MSDPHNAHPAADPAAPGSWRCANKEAVHNICRTSTREGFSTDSQFVS
jgi:hypothetical protein